MTATEQQLRETLAKASAKIRELLAANEAAQQQEPIAIVGLACRFPGGESAEAFWELLARGGDAVTPVPRERWDAERWLDPDPDAPGRLYTREGAFLGDVAGFDAGFFGITPREAEALDPQQRILLETSWHALEDAALDTRVLRGTQTGVFVGLANYDYIQAHIHSGDAARITPYSGSGVMFSTAAGRLSYVYDFRGPCLTIDTACSSSLVALHLAMESLQRRECDAALAAGVSLQLSVDSAIALCKVKALAADGRSRPFDDAASGYGRGEGCGVVVLKRLADARRDGDRIYAVLRGSAVNHDGRSNGLTAPNGPAQQAVIRAAMLRAGVAPHEVEYVETHGTGTKLGDPIEFHALAQVFGKSPLRIGSVKSNIGHAEAAAGIASVIKVVLAMQHEQLPPSIHFETPNRHIDWDEAPIRVVDALQPWRADAVAGVSSFGLSGTNAHVIVGGMPRGASTAADGPHLLTLSASTPEALEARIEAMHTFLGTTTEGVPDLCHTAARRTRLAHAISVRGATREELRAALAARAFVNADSQTIAGARVVALPPYPFQHTRYWMELTPGRVLGSSAPRLLGKNESPCEPEDPRSRGAEDPRKAGPVDRQNSVADQIAAILADVTGMQPEAIDRKQNLMEMGLDSLMLLKVGQTVERAFGVTLQISQFFQELSNIEDLAAYLAQHAPSAPAAQVAVTAPQVATPVVATPMPAMPQASGDVRSILEQQWQLLAQMSTLAQQQAALIGTSAAPAATAATAAPPPVKLPTTHVAKTNFRNLNLAGGAPLTEQQKQFVDDVVRRHVERTRTSKELTQKHRDVLADWKHTLSFWSQFKEAKYPIVSARSEGPRFWDVDGNEYIDLAIGMGVNFFGHRAPFLHEALQRQMDEGLELGTQSDLTGEVARLIHELTGVERVTFSNTGSESVMVAIRLARAATRRDKIVLFRESYHGIFDGVLAAEEDGAIVPVGLGTPRGMIEDVYVLEYGARETLDFIREHADELAAVLVEPVQSRNPDLQPQGFLKQLRALTRERGVALIFDEMITGFRIHPGGAQAWFGIDADIAVYGKIVGGGLPIGVIAGKAKFLDYIDGGFWEYGDRSGPRSDMIYFGGTFGRNPATMATAHAALTHMKREGAALQEAVCARTTEFCDALNYWLERERVPLRAKYFASQWRLVAVDDHAQPLELELLWLLLMQRRIYTWERRICFFSTEHDDLVVQRVLAAIRESILEIRAHGFPFEGEGPRQFAAPSSTQRRQYALAQRPGGQLPYHLPQAMRIDGPLDVDRLEASFREVIARHESLRTSFCLIEGELVMKRWDEPRFSIERLTSREEFYRPFDLAAAPLLRVGVLQLAPERHLLLADAHHIVADGLSFNVIAAELMALYEGASLPPVTYDFRECVAIHDAAGDARDEAFWREQLAGELPLLELPADRPRRSEPDFQGDHVLTTIAPEITRRLKELGRATNSSLYMILLAAFDVLLHRLTLQNDILVGGGVSGRRDPRLANAVGMFVNTVVYRARPQWHTPFRALLDAVRADCLAVYDHQDYPFEKMARLNTSRPHDRNALFDAMLSYENASERAFRIRELTFTTEEVRLPAAMFDLGLDVIEEHDALHLDFAYATSLFDRATVERWSGYFARILTAILDDPERPIGRFDLLGDDERALIAAFNETSASYPDTTIINLFEEQAARTPEHLATNTLTYAQLNASAEELAGELRARGLGAGDFAGILLPRTERYLSAILAILKCGAAYVPLDVDYPEERTRFMVEDSGCKLLITSDGIVSRTVSAAPQPGAAYVIYTSGSTGQPKGCLVTNRNVVRLLKNDRHDFDFGDRDVWTIAHSFCFDFSVWEMYGALLNGGRCLVVPTEIVRDAPAFRSLIAHERVTVLNQTPGAFYSLIEAECAASSHMLDRHLRYVIFGGDRLEPAYLRRWYELYPDVALINMYGITETTVHVTYYRITAGDILGNAGRSIVGRPIPETTVHVLDEALQPQPLGVAGELYVGGSGVSRGYLNRPDLTAQRFLDTPHGRLYRSGDLGRLLPNGTLEHLGRNDHQVQIRGYRVELGEVTQRLLEHPSIEKAFVTDREGVNGTRQLVAYLVACDTLDADALRAHLAATLPSYMIPSHFVQLAALPLTSNGKVDRKALPAPEAERVSTGSAYVAPRNEAEAALAAVWSEVLLQADVGIRDDYFALGGDSITALQIASRLHHAGWTLELRHLFEQRTIERLAPLLRARDAAFASRANVARAPLTPIQRWFFAEHPHGREHFNQSVLLRAAERVDIATLRRAIEMLHAQHEMLSARFTSDAQELGAPAPAVEVVETDDIAAHADALQASFDLARGPLFQCVLYRSGDSDHVFLLLHHLIVDGVSWRVLLEDFAAAYAGQPLPPRADSYLRWAQIVADYARTISGESDYWRAVEAVPALSIPPDYDAPRNVYGDAVTVERSIEQLPSGAPLQELLLTALARAARRCYGVERSRILLEGHGREELAPGSDFSRTVGWFTTLYPFVLDDHVAESLRNIPSKGIGYSALRYLAGTAFAELPEVVFNYLGTFHDDRNGAWAFDDAATGRAHGDDVERGHLIEIETAVIGGRLRIALAYNRSIHAAATIECFLDAYVQELEAPRTFPLTPLQEGILFHSLDGSSSYFEQLSYRISGPLDVPRFFEAWQELARRHEVLRAGIDTSGARPMHVMRGDARIETTYLDVRGDTDAVRRFADEDRARGFDLRGPLMRVAVLRTGESDYEVLWSHHHVILDGWSVGVLHQELVAIYDGGAAQLAPPAPYRAFVEWLESRDQSASRRYWSGVLRDVPPPASVPGVIAAARYDLHEEIVRIDRDTTRALHDFAARAGATMNSVIQSAWAALLALYNDRDDVLFGAVVSGRPPELRGVERMAGLFLQTIPVRVRVERDDTLATLAARLQGDALAAAPHHHFALAEMQQLSGRAKPLFDHVVVFENYPLDGAAAPRGLRLGAFAAREQMHYDYSLVVHPNEELELKLTHNANALPAESAATIVRHLRTLLEQALTGAPLREVALESRGSEPRPIAQEHGSVLALFEEQARRTPDAIAVDCGGELLTYGELDARASAMRLDLQPGELVAIRIPNSIDYVVAMLAVMKSGGVFAPLAVDWPQRRIDALLEQLDPRAVIDAHGITHRQTRGTRAPDGAAYVMFTSGSTGEPKAILGTHAGLHHFIDWERNEVGADASLRTSNLALTTFDVSLRDLFLPLVSGGTVCIPDAATRADMPRLARWLRDARVTLMHVVPSIFRMLIKEVDALPDLRVIAFAGEPLYGRDVLRARDVLGNEVVLLNLYGPSETTLAKACYRIPTEFDDAARMVPVGTPIAGTRIVLMKDGRVAPRGAIGELHIEPPFRCLGYLGDRERTAEAFADNVYRTGDLGRELPDGTIELIGRRDRQVKIAGVRIELAEIDRAVAACAGIEETLAVAHKQPDGELAVACYFTESAPVSIATLREQLAESLPAWMIPTWFVRLDAFPLSANGKIDRRALPKPEELLPSRIRYEAPANETETRIAAIWAEALGLKRVGVLSPFFEIGGNSLRAIRIIGRINRELGASLTIRGFFECPTIRELARRLRPVQNDHPLSHAQRRLWVLDQLGLQPLAYSLPAAFVLDGALDVEALRRAFTALVNRHESLRTTIVEIDGEPRQRVHDAADFRLEVIDLSDSSDAEAEARELAREQAARPFDLGRGPLLRATLVRLDGRRHVLLANLHHIVSDAWSITVIARELSQLYRGETPAPLRLQYRDFAAWQNAQVESESGLAARDYWHRQFATLPEPLRLPLDQPRPAVPSFRGGRVRRALDAELARALRSFASEQRGSAFMAVVAAVKALLYRYTGQRDLVVGSPVSNRSEENDDQIGFYVNMLPLRDEVRGDESFAQLFARVRDTVLGAVEQSIYPFDRLVQDLALGRRNLFDVVVVLQQDAGRQALELEGVRVSELDSGAPAAKFTLSFEFVEQRGGAMLLNLEYDAELFRAATVERLAAHLVTLLRDALAHPERPLDSLQLLTSGETEILLSAQIEPSRGETIVSLFEQIAAEHADREAVVCETRSLTYAQLNARANGIAQALGCARGELVAVLLDRSELLVAAFLGILKRGAAYVPIDPSYPRERVAHMLRDSGARVVLTQREHEHLLDAAIERIDVTTIGGDANNPPRVAAANDLAYVIYTSGSTGLPKGVLLEHDGAVALAAAHREFLRIEPRHRILQFAPSSFDASVWEMVMALLHGAALVIATPERIRDARAFARYLAEQRVSVATLPPSYLAQLSAEDVAPLELLVTAGEPPNVEQALALARQLRYVNAYGPTETTVCATWHEVDPARRYDGVIPIGNAIPNAEVYVLDEARNLVPCGVTGEIYIGGRGLARGYHDQPELTARHFVAHPFREGARLYRSGDLAYRLPDGELVYTGRNDAQVKIRGHRVELGEIEQALLAAPEVHNAVVAARGGELVAYVVTHGDLSVAALREHLARRLPESMLPSRWLRLDALPLMPNGKVDRAALPDVAEAPRASAEPRTELERLIAAAWQEVLRNGSGIFDRFYESGGDSIKAIQIVSRLRRAGLSVEMRDFLEHPTIAGLAARIEVKGVAPAAAPRAGVALTSNELELLAHE
ncbi:MAG TPA: amino acid adenylation domain-containing protein [Thermoanaerobaculia bacterium]|jgi:amino acid adenylation domain-containing protein/non-ribosomal peptide synthase protein (TIGR01720 family)